MTQPLEEIKKKLYLMCDRKNSAYAEFVHLEADKLLLEALEQLGRKDIADAWRMANSCVNFWYA